VYGIGFVGGPRVGSVGGCILDDGGEDRALRHHSGSLQCHADATAAGGSAGRAQRRVGSRRCHRRSRWRTPGGGRREARVVGRKRRSIRPGRCSGAIFYLRVHLLALDVSVCRLPRPTTTVAALRHRVAHPHVDGTAGTRRGCCIETWRTRRR
jgi:hypothetical protein